MIIYGTDIPHICSNCGHDQQKIHIFRNFFSLFYIPVIPLQKNAIVNCPNCGNQCNKKDFLKLFRSSSEALTFISNLLGRAEKKLDLEDISCFQSVSKLLERSG